MLDYLHNLNPKEDEKTILIYGSKYHLWRDGKYIGVATWTKDENVGDSFQDRSGDDIIVFKADHWQLIPK
jgi:hypothetical protein